jgi:hypothetical protein
LSVGGCEERLAVVRARDRPLLLFGLSFGCGFSGDVSELFPGDGSSSVVSVGRSSTCGLPSASLLGPPWTVIFGMVPSS